MLSYPVIETVPTFKEMSENKMRHQGNQYQITEELLMRIRFKVKPASCFQKVNSGTSDKRNMTRKLELD